ncbi:MAG: undecaprenyl-diphosphate phosphatase [bacterium]
MDWLQIIILSLVQGLTEFLPISSSAHLILPSLLTDWPDQGLAFDVGVHFGTLLAVVTYFRADLLQMTTAVVTYPTHRIYKPEIDLVLKLALATLPVMVAGLFGKDFIEHHLRSVPVIATTTIVFGIALWLADRKPGKLALLSWGQALFIGGMQMLALIPGTSRSGITITAALMVGLTRTSAARFSFLLAIPTILGAQILLSLDLVREAQQQQWLDLFTGALLSGLAAYACIAFFIALVERTGMTPYVIYRLLLGTALFAIYLQ